MTCVNISGDEARSGLLPRLLGRGVAAALMATAGGALALSPDLEREQRIRTEIVDAILDGEPIDLHARGGQRFLGILTPSAAEPVRGTVVILHGRGFHPDWANVVHPLRVGLAQHGWNTLSIQLPVLGKEAKYFDYLGVFPDASVRISAAVRRARQEQGDKVVLLAHSCGSHMANHWLLSRDAQLPPDIDAFVGIGMGATDYGQPMRDRFALDRFDGPVLDLYGEHDYPAVHRLAAERLAVMNRADHPLSEQRMVPEAGHYFVNRGDALLQAVASWLDKM